jgi:hypothetical protein
VGLCWMKLRLFLKVLVFFGKSISSDGRKITRWWEITSDSG